MATISKEVLSGSPDGAPIAMPINTGTFTTIHTGPSVASSYSEVWIWACNAIGTSAEVVTIRIGGTANENKIKATINPNETVLLVPGTLIKGNASTAVVIDGASTSAGKVNVFGYVNQIVG